MKNPPTLRERLRRTGLDSPLALSRRQFLCRGNHQDRTALGTLSAVPSAGNPQDRTALPTQWLPYVSFQKSNRITIYRITI
ncbi:hypothetical protein [Nostoc sp. 106C]|uniref:hypothetical protein n=1 Tax=Nostoc sp. 106C TaxID=1932667 RepID=UPI00117BE41F|nr:hypothetical protein [Nostoc sp. 106C]